MTTKLTVTSASHGTLKQKKNLVRRLMHVAATLFFAVTALTAMSFTQDDTTKFSDNYAVGQSKNNDDTLHNVTLVSGVQRIVITNKNAFSADVRINDMDLNTWLNSMMAYSYKKINYGSIGTADNTMDAAFSNDEQLNFNRSVSFGKTLNSELMKADEGLHASFVKTVEAPLFQKTLQEELTEADAKMDKIMGDEIETRMKAVQFTKTMNAVADEEMDMLMNASLLTNIKPSAAMEADAAIDHLLLKNTFKHIDATSVFQADQMMDKLMNSSN